MFQWEIWVYLTTPIPIIGNMMITKWIQGRSLAKPIFLKSISATNFYMPINFTTPFFNQDIINICRNSHVPRTTLRDEHATHFLEADEHAMDDHGHYENVFALLLCTLQWQLCNMSWRRLQLVRWLVGWLVKPTSQPLRNILYIYIYSKYHSDIGVSSTFTNLAIYQGGAYPSWAMKIMKDTSPFEYFWLVTIVGYTNLFLGENYSYGPK